MSHRYNAQRIAEFEKSLEQALAILEDAKEPLRRVDLARIMCVTDNTAGNYVRTLQARGHAVALAVHKSNGINRDKWRRIRKLRDEGLTYPEIAELVGVSVSSAQRIIRQSKENEKPKEPAIKTCWMALLADGGSLSVSCGLGEDHAARKGEAQLRGRPTVFSGILPIKEASRRMLAHGAQRAAA